MESSNNLNISFLNLDGVDQEEAQTVITWLSEKNPHVKFPWHRRRPKQAPAQMVSLPEPVEVHPQNTYRGSQPYPLYVNPVEFAPYLPSDHYSPVLYPPMTYPINQPSYLVYPSYSYNYAGPVPPFETTVMHQELYVAPEVTEMVSEPPPVIENDVVKVNGVIEVETPPPTPPAPRSWAGLFSKSPGSNNGDKSPESVHYQEVIYTACPIRQPKKTPFTDPNSYRMGEFLWSHKFDGRTISVQPRGLINRSNYCYINSILQALIACPPVYALLTGVGAQITSPTKDKATPIIDAMCRFVKEFQLLPAGLRVNRRNQKYAQGIDYDLPIEPSWLYRILNGARSDSFQIEGRQEDAEEFLGCLLNGLNDEMTELMKFVGESEKGWQVSGPKTKGSAMNQSGGVRTPISQIFGGALKSSIHRTGDTSSSNVQPFYTLQLNIKRVRTVREALDALSNKIQLEGVTSEKTKKEVEAWQQVTLEELPMILVLHLKCFDYKHTGCTKIMKALEFPIDLKIDTKLISPSKLVAQKEKQYKLMAVVYHDGKEATKGHYITDAFHVGYSSWIRYDDSTVKAVREEQVLNPQGTRVPYLLFYRRSDTIRSK